MLLLPLHKISPEWGSRISYHANSIISHFHIGKIHHGGTSLRVINEIFDEAMNITKENSNYQISIAFSYKLQNKTLCEQVFLIISGTHGQTTAELA